jgi:hypothetical protein
MNSAKNKPSLRRCILQLYIVFNKEMMIPWYIVTAGSSLAGVENLGGEDVPVSIVKLI